jgi:hypothetical protein
MLTNCIQDWRDQISTAKRLGRVALSHHMDLQKQHIFRVTFSSSMNRELPFAFECLLLLGDGGRDAKLWKWCL